MLASGLIRLLTFASRRKSAVFVAPPQSKRGQILLPFAHFICLRDFDTVAFSEAMLRSLTGSQRGCALLLSGTGQPFIIDRVIIYSAAREDSRFGDAWRNVCRIAPDGDGHPI